MLILRALPPGGELPSLSPFVLKAMGWLTVLELDWSADYRANIRKQPNGKLPVLVDGTRVIPDSEAIARHLQGLAGRWLDADLNPREAALSQALIRMAEEHVYFIAVWNRWSVEENFAPIRAVLQRALPFPLSRLLPGIVRRGVLGQVRAQGIGRMDADLRQARLGADLDALAAVLGRGPWLFGTGIRAADISVSAMLLTLLACPAETPVRRELSARAGLVAYAERARREIFPAPGEVRRVARQ